MEYEGKQYQIGKLSAREQLHVVRRLAPALSAAVAAQPVILKALKGDTAALGELVPMAQLLAQMPDVDVDYVLNTCLRVVKRTDAGITTSITTAQGTLMFQDIDMGGMLRLTGAVLQENLSSFFSVSNPSSPHQNTSG